MSDGRTPYQTALASVRGIRNDPIPVRGRISEMTDMPELKGIHHLKMPVSNLATSLDFYERALGARRIAEADHRRGDGSLFAYILAVPGLGTKLELRLHPQRAKSHAGFDPVTIAVEDRAVLDRWIDYLDQA